MSKHGTSTPSSPPDLICAELVGIASAQSPARPWGVGRRDDVGLSSLAMGAVAPLAGLGECPPYRYRTLGDYPRPGRPQPLHQTAVRHCRLRAHLGAMAGVRSNLGSAERCAVGRDGPRLYAEEAPTGKRARLYALMKQIQAEATIRNDPLRRAKGRGDANPSDRFQ